MNRVFILFIVLVAAAPLAAQYTPGDILVTDQRAVSSGWRLLGMTPQGVLYTVTTKLKFAAWAIAPAPDNRTVWLAGKSNLGYTLARMAQNGTITNLNVDNNNNFSHIDADGGGNAILGNLAGPEILKYAASGLSTIFAGAPLQNVEGGGIDLQTGDYFTVHSTSILRTNLTGTPAPTTVVTGIAQWKQGASLHTDPESGALIGSWANGIYQVMPGSPGVLKTLLSGVMNLGALDRDPATGDFVVSEPGGRVASRVYRYNVRTNTLTTLGLLPLGSMPVTTTVSASRHLCAGNEARPGQNFGMLVSSPNEPRASYVVALSFGFRPGIPLPGGRKVYLQPDPLFALSLTNTGLFRNFQGTLDNRGEAIATLTVPNIPALAGYRFYAACITVRQGAIGVISDPLGVTIR